jgi:hypothetical protein
MSRYLLYLYPRLLFDIEQWTVLGAESIDMNASHNQLLQIPWILCCRCSIKRRSRRGIWSVALFFTALVDLCSALQSSSSLPPPARLQQLLQSEMEGTRHSDSPILLPCCYDGLTARLIARFASQGSPSLPPHHFEATFLTGFGASASYGIPDTQLISYQEMLHTCAVVAEALASVALERPSLQQHPIPCIAVRLLHFALYI